MIDKINNNNIPQLSIFDLIFILINEYKKILLITLISFMCFLIFSVFIPAKYQTYIAVYSDDSSKFKYTAQINEYLNNSQLSSSDINLLFQNNFLEYQNFADYYYSQQNIKVDDLDKFYNSFDYRKNDDDKISDTRSYIYFVNHQFKKKLIIEEFLLNYLDYTHSLTLKNIFYNIKQDSKSIKFQIDSIIAKEKIKKEFRLKNNIDLLAIYSQEDQYKIEKQIEIITDNLAIAKKLNFEDPVGNVQSYLSALNKMMFSNIESNDSNLAYKDVTNSLNKNKFASYENPLFFLGDKILLKYLEILNEDKKLIKENSYKNYPVLSTAISSKNIIYDNSQINLLAELTNKKNTTELALTSFQLLKNDLKLVKYSKKRINTNLTSTRNIINFIISILVGLISGVFFVLTSKMLRIQNEFSQINKN